MKRYEVMHKGWRTGGKVGVRRVVVVCLMAGLGVGMVGCGEKEGAGEKDEVVVVEGMTPEVYQVRGVVRGLPRGDEGDGKMQLMHEAIPGFKNKRGEVVGMQSMTMGFPMGEGVEVGDLKEGDKVNVEFVVTWGEKPYYITKVEKLPDDTELEFRGTKKMDHQESGAEGQ